jgi:hypothetical protein
MVQYTNLLQIFFKLYYNLHTNLKSRNRKQLYILKFQNDWSCTKQMAEFKIPLQDIKSYVIQNTAILYWINVTQML